MVAQAEIWLMETPNQKRRPVLTTRLGELGLGRRRQICEALDALANC